MTTQQKHHQKLVATYFKNKQMRKFIVPYIVLAMATIVFFLLLIKKDPNSLFINPDLAFFLFCYGAAMFTVSCFIIGLSLMIFLEKISGEALQNYYEKNEKAAEKYIQRMLELENSLEKEDDEEQQLRLKKRMLSIQKKLWKLEFECNLIDRKEGFLSMIKIKLLSEQ